MDTTARLECKCKNAFQDEQYGKGIRLHNLTVRANQEKIVKGDRVARCTVCGTEKKI